MEAQLEVVSYSQVEALIYYLCGRYRRCYGGELDELIGIANLVFVKATRNFDPSKGPLAKRISFLVWHALNKERKRQARFVSSSPEDLCLLVGTDVTNWLDSFLRYASDDAETICRLACSLERQSLSAVRAGLVELGWGPSRIDRGFREVRELL